MITPNALSSVEYYIESSEKLGAVETFRKGVNKSKANGGYYMDPKMQVDPLWRPLVVQGKSTKHLGLKEGQALSAEQFRNLYFGFTPDGRTPLHDGVSPKDEQAAASKEARKLELAKDNAEAAMKETLKAAEKKHGNKVDAAGDATVIEATKKYEKAKATLDHHRANSAYRRAGEDITFSTPPGFSLLHASLMTQGKFDEAKKLEEFYVGLVNKEMERMSQFVTTSEGRDDSHGIPGAKAEIIWTTCVHFDVRPDENGNTGHIMHVHCPVPNYGRTKDGEWKPVRLEEMKEARHVSDAYINSAMAIYMQKNHDADITFKVAKKGRLIPEMGAERFLAKNPDNPLFGRSKQIAENIEKGLRGDAAKRSGKKRKADLTGQEHIDMQRELLREAGLGDMRTILGSKREREAQVKAMAEERLVRKYENEITAWRRLEADNGFPNGRPVPFKGQEARLYMEFSEMAKKKHKDVRRPLAPPGERGHRKDWWSKAVEFERKKIAGIEADKVSLNPEKVVKRLSATEPFISESRLREEIARALPAHPPKRLFGGWGKQENLLDEIRARTERIYNDIINSGYVVMSAQGKQRGFVSSELRHKEREAYGKTLPDLFKRDSGVRSLSKDEVAGFLADWQRIKGFEFKPKQAQVAFDIGMAQSRAIVIQGFAGSGKTAIAEAVVSMLEKMDYRVLACAPSNSAMTGLVEEIKAGGGFTPQKLNAALGLSPETTLDKNTVIYLDEVSMLDVSSGAELLKAVNESGARILLSGDIKQLSSVGAGNLFEHTLEIAGEAERLDPDGGKRITRINEDYTDAQTIQRQRTRIGKQFVAEMQTGDWANALRTMRAQGMLEVKETETDCIEAIGRGYAGEMGKHTGSTPELMRAWQEARRTGGDVEGARKMLEEGLRMSAKGYRDNIMLAETNANVARLAAGARRDLKAMGLLDEQDIMINGEMGAMPVAIGERLVLRAKTTTKDALASNGDGFEYNKGTQALLVDIKRGADGAPILVLQMDKANGKGTDRIEVNAKDFSNLAYGTAMTVHLSQGISVDNCFYLPSKNTNSQLGLVANSRFKVSNRMFVPEGDERKILKAMFGKKRAPDALDLDRLCAEGDVESATRFAKAPEKDKLALEATARAQAVKVFEDKLEAGDPALAEAVRRVAQDLKRPEVARAALQGIVRREAGIFGRWGADRSENKSWLGETEDGSILAYDAKTGRIESWSARDAKKDGMDGVARRSSFGQRLQETMLAARDEGKRLTRDGDVKGRITAMGIAPLHDSPGEKPTPWVELVDPATGAKTKKWGADIDRAIRIGGFKIGDGVALDGDRRVDVDVFSSEPMDGGHVGTRSGTLVKPPRNGGPATVRLETGTISVYGKAAQAWAGRAEGERVEVYSKTAKKQMWEARAHVFGSRIEHARRKAAWDAVETALASQERLDALASVGVGKRTFGDAQITPREAALRLWTEGRTQTGAESVYDWNEIVGSGRRTWHEAGALEKGADGIAKADLTTMVLHSDDERVYVAAAVQGQTGEIEGAASRIMAFDKKDLGLDRIHDGAMLLIRCSDDSDKPSLVRIGEEREHRPILAASEQRRIFERVVKGMAQDEINEILARGSANADDRHDTAPTKTLPETSPISDTTLMNGIPLLGATPLLNTIMGKPDEKQTGRDTTAADEKQPAVAATTPTTLEERLERMRLDKKKAGDDTKPQATTSQETPEAKPEVVAAMLKSEDFYQRSHDERIERMRLMTEELDRKRAERKAAEAPAAKQKADELEKRHQQDEQTRQANEAARIFRDRNLEDARKTVAEKLQANSDAEPNHHANDEAFELAYTEMLMNDDKNGINGLLTDCPLDRPDRMARLIHEGGADPVIGTIAGFSANECLAELPAGCGDENVERLMKLGADPFNGVKGKSDGKTFAERHGLEAEAANDESASAAAKPASRGRGMR